MAFLPVIAMAATAAGAAVSAFGAIRGGIAQQNMYNYQAAVARINEEHVRQVGEREAAMSGMRTQAEVGNIKAAQGASNLDVNRGSALAVQKSQLALGYLDENTIRSNAAWRAFGYETQAQLDTTAGKEAKTSGMISGISSILGGAGSVAGKWVQWGSMSGSNPVDIYGNS